MKTNRYMILTPKVENLRKALHFKGMTATRTTTTMTTITSLLLTKRKKAKPSRTTTRRIMSFDRVKLALTFKTPLRSI
jgi:hypothetical protein